MTDTPRTDFVAHESGDAEWNRFPNRFGRMTAHAQILERELAETKRLLAEALPHLYDTAPAELYDRINAAIKEAK